MADDALTRKDAEMGRLAEWLDSQDFYELCQQYRHAQDLLPRAPGLLTAAQAYEELKRQIRERALSLESVREEALASLKECTYALQQAIRTGKIGWLQETALETALRISIAPAESVMETKRNAARYLWWRNAKIAEASHDYHFDDLLGKIENACDLTHEIDAAIDADMGIGALQHAPARVAEGGPAITEEKIGDLLAELEILNFMDVGAPRHQRKKEYEHIREFLISLAPGVVEPNFEKAKK